ncbi:MAG: DUF4271 domain-containing protein [Prevotellaceae bacterium]|jgi:hypothetical protein|nr:DUF4271 domain-containing protein [Prevotellaceae bacterium]
MIADSLINNTTEAQGSLYVPVEFKIFGEHSEAYNKVSEIEEAKALNNSDYFVKSGVAVGLSVYFLLLLFVLKRRISSLCKMFFDYRFAKKQYEETNRISVMNTGYTVLFTIIVASALFSLMSNYQEYRLYAVPFLVLSGIFTVQSAALKLIALICKAENIFGEIHLNRRLYLSITGIAILPLTVVALLYSDSDIKVEQSMFLMSKILIGVLMLFMTVRIIRIFSEAKVSYFFRFLYFCTFEISPYLALFIVFENIN